MQEFVGIVGKMAREFPELLVWRAVLADRPAGHRPAGRGAQALRGVRARGLRRAPARHDLVHDAQPARRGVRAAARHRARADPLPQLLPYRERIVQDALAANWGSVERFLGSLAAVTGDYETACEHFETALERNAAWGMRQAVRAAPAPSTPRCCSPAAVPATPSARPSCCGPCSAGLEEAGLPVLADFVRMQLDGLERRAGARRSETPN